MKTKIAHTEHNNGDADAIERYAKECWRYVTMVVNIVREPVLVLDKDLQVMAANEPFYRMFQVEPRDTEGTVVYKLGNGQWNIPALRKLLEEILPHNTFFNNFEVEHAFPFIGHKSMVLNARQIHGTSNGIPALLPPIIFLAIEDVTPMMAIADTLATHMKGLSAKAPERALDRDGYLIKLERDLGIQKKRLD